MLKTERYFSILLLLMLLLVIGFGAIEHERE
jgi:hypothetical protein